MNNCTQCGNAYANRWNLARHVAVSHPKPLKNVEDDIGLETGVKRKRELKEMDSAEDSGSENELQTVVSDKAPPEDSDSGCSNNSSSEDSDDCESSSDHSSGDESQDETSNDGVTRDGDATEVEEEVTQEESENKERESLQRKYTSLARWRERDCGLYSTWSSRSRKPHFVQHREWLEKLLNPSCKIRKSLIKKASDSQLEAIREISSNVLRGNVMLNLKQFRFMRENRAMIRLLSSEDSSYHILRKALLIPEFAHVLPLLLMYVKPTCIKSAKVAYKPDESDESSE